MKTTKGMTIGLAAVLKKAPTPIAGVVQRCPQAPVASRAAPRQAGSLYDAARFSD